MAPGHESPCNFREQAAPFGSRYDPYQRQLHVHTSSGAPGRVKNISCAHGSTPDVIYPRRAPKPSALHAKSQYFFHAMRLPRACGGRVTNWWAHRPAWECVWVTAVEKNSGMRRPRFFFSRWHATLEFVSPSTVPLFLRLDVNTIYLFVSRGSVKTCVFETVLLYFGNMQPCWLILKQALKNEYAGRSTFKISYIIECPSFRQLYIDSCMSCTKYSTQI